MKAQSFFILYHKRISSQMWGGEISRGQSGAKSLKTEKGLTVINCKPLKSLVEVDRIE